MMVLAALATSRAFLAEHLSAATTTPQRHAAATCTPQLTMQADGRSRDVNRRRKRRQGSDDIMRAAAARWAENEAAAASDKTVNAGVTDENFAALESLITPSERTADSVTDESFSALEALIKTSKAARPLRGGRRRSQERDEARRNVTEAVTRWEASLQARSGRRTRESEDAEAAERRADEQRAALHAAMQTWAEQTEAEALDALNAMMDRSECEDRGEVR